jgi:uncharacterized protein (DUF736 family)
VIAYELREGSGNIFRNDKRGNERAPDFAGDALLDGKRVRLAAWKKKNVKGELFLSVTLHRPQPRSTPQDPMTDVNLVPAARSGNDIDDDFPF